MLATLQNVPNDAQSWERFAQDNRSSHEVIRTALLSRGVALDEYVLYPIDQSDWPGWLQRHALSHEVMTKATHNTSMDLSLLDPKNQAAVSSWIQSHWLEHQAVESSLKVAS